MRSSNKLDILYEDNSIIVCYKPAGVSSQTERGFDPDMVSILSNYGLPYVGVIHRLDKPVCGVMVYAKTKKAAGTLSGQLASNSFSKHYYAIVHMSDGIHTSDAICGISSPFRSDAVDDLAASDLTETYRLCDYLLHDVKSNSSSVVDSSVVDKGTSGAKEAILEYSIVKQFTVNDIYGDPIPLALLDVHLLTGRHHQIRVQLSHAGMPIVGDRKYGTQTSDNSTGNSPTSISTALPSVFRRTGLALAAYNLSFKHPDTGKIMEFTRAPQGGLWDELR